MQKKSFRNILFILVASMMMTSCGESSASVDSSSSLPSLSSESASVSSSEASSSLPSSSSSVSSSEASSSIASSSTSSSQESSSISSISSEGPKDGTPLVRNDVKINYTRIVDETTKTLTDLKYDENWFLGDSYTYNNDLALMSLALTLADDTFVEGEKDESIDGNAYIEHLMLELGYPQDSIYTYKCPIESDKENDLAFSTKQIKDKDGNMVNLCVLNVRSTYYGAGGWKGNANVGLGETDTVDVDNIKYHLGFYQAANFVLSKFEQYASDQNLDLSNTKFWIPGFSRDAAIANLVSILLGEKEGVDRKNIFTYAFATPTYIVDSSSEAIYKNIFNIANPSDFIPRIPLAEWDFSTQGTKVTLPTLTEQTYPKFKEIYKGLSDVEYNTPMDNKPVADLALGILSDNIPTRKDFAELYWPIVQGVFTVDADGNMDMSYLDHILACEGTSEDVSVASIIASLKDADFSDIQTLLPVISPLIVSLGDAQEYWESEDPECNEARFMSSFMGLFNDILNLVMSTDDSTPEGLVKAAFVEQLKNTFPNWKLSSFIQPHYPESYISYLKLAA